MSKKENEAYISMKLDPILFPITVKTFEKNPEDPVQFMLDQIKTTYG